MGTYIQLRVKNEELRVSERYVFVDMQLVRFRLTKNEFREKISCEGNRIAS